MEIMTWREFFGRLWRRAGIDIESAQKLKEALTQKILMRETAAEELTRIKSEALQAARSATLYIDLQRAKRIIADVSHTLINSDGDLHEWLYVMELDESEISVEGEGLERIVILPAATCANHVRAYFEGAGLVVSVFPADRQRNSRWKSRDGKYKMHVKYRS